MPTIKSANTYLLLISLLLLLPSQASFSQTHIELTPSLSIIEEYDDNIYLSDQNETSDYITMVSPSLNFNLLSQHTQFGLEYTPTFVWYSEDSEDSTIRHSGSLTFGQDLSEHLRFDLSDTYAKSDDPLEETEGVVLGARDTRNTYQRNSGHASLTYRFGSENSIAFGYRDERLRNDDDSENDGTTKNPYATIDYNINRWHRLEIEYGYTTAHFWTNDGTVAEDDYYGNEPRIAYRYNFTPHTTGILEYHFTTRNFKGAEEDYKVHDSSLGFEHAFSPSYSISAGAGYFIQKNAYSNDETGLTYDVSMTRRFERGSINIGGEGGWDEAVLDPDDTGFTRFWSLGAAVDYQILESLTTYATGSYRHDKDDDDWILGSNTYDNRNYDVTSGSCGLRWAFLRWFSLSLDYAYTERDDDITTESYTDNRVSLTLTASRLYRW